MSKYLITAEKSVKQYEQLKTDIINQVDNLVIINEQKVKEGKELLKDINTLQKKIKTEKEGALQPLKDLQKQISKLVDDFILSIDKSKDNLKSKLLSYEELQQKLEQQAVTSMKEEFGVEVIPQLKKFVSGVRTREEVIITDEAVIPREFCSPDMAKIKSAIKLGKEVPGIKINTIKTIQ